MATTFNSFYVIIMLRNGIIYVFIPWDTSFRTKNI